MSLWPASSVSSKLEKARAEAAKLTTEIAAQQTELDGALIADPPAPAKIEKLESAIAEKRRRAEREQHTVELLEQQVAEQERAQAAAKKAKEGERAEAVVKAWAKNAAALEKAIGEVAALYGKQVELGIEVDAAWPWTGQERGSLKLTSGELKPLVEIEMFRSSALRPAAAGGDDHYVLPGAVCPIGDRLQPQKIPSLSSVLRDRAQYAIDRLRAAVETARGEAA